MVFPSSYLYNLDICCIYSYLYSGGGLLWLIIYLLKYLNRTSEDFACFREVKRESLVPEVPLEPRRVWGGWSDGAPRQEYRITGPPGPQDWMGNPYVFCFFHSFMFHSLYLAFHVITPNNLMQGENFQKSLFDKFALMY